MKTLKSMGIGALGLLGAVYLVNPGAGIFELLPDNLPFVGNVDEALATALLLGALRYFGLDLNRRFERRPPPAP